MPRNGDEAHCEGTPKAMNKLHSDALLGGAWSWDAEEDDAYVEDHREQIHDLLRDLIDTLDD